MPADSTSKPVFYCWKKVPADKEHPDPDWKISEPKTPNIGADPGFKTPVGAVFAPFWRRDDAGSV